MKPSLLLIAILCCTSISLHAQERTAGGNLQNEASWNALKGIADSANNNAKSAHIRLNQVEACGKLGMFYAPGAAGSDGQGCKAPAMGNQGSRWSRDSGYAWAGPLLFQWGRTCLGYSTEVHVPLPVTYPNAIMNVVGQLDEQHFGATRANQYVRIVNNGTILAGKTNINGCMNWLTTGY
ncbi:MAG: hypothetical protein DI628_07000 [Blastochloris viridis]|uniref:Putative tail fiber protein gp53-like C-terminal domain-containing protein n=1 Tax=Blastochloris viridis TaxID=1079 RepID=A0A6N4RC36_BLAVI|nr:MAG: hypothetical protein DI628_07000 [Blastochloris viridis]